MSHSDDEKKFMSFCANFLHNVDGATKRTPFGSANMNSNTNGNGYIPSYFYVPSAPSQTVYVNNVSPGSTPFKDDDKRDDKKDDDKKDNNLFNKLCLSVASIAIMGVSAYMITNDWCDYSQMMKGKYYAKKLSGKNDISKMAEQYLKYHKIQKKYFMINLVSKWTCGALLLGQFLGGVLNGSSFFSGNNLLWFTLLFGVSFSVNIANRTHYSLVTDVEREEIIEEIRFGFNANKKVD